MVHTRKTKVSMHHSLFFHWAESKSKKKWIFLDWLWCTPWMHEHCFRTNLPASYFQIPFACFVPSFIFLIDLFDSTESSNHFSILLNSSNQSLLKTNWSLTSSSLILTFVQSNWLLTLTWSFLSFHLTTKFFLYQTSFLHCVIQWWVL